MADDYLLSIQFGWGQWDAIGEQALIGKSVVYARQRYIVFGSKEDAEWYGYFVVRQCPHVKCHVVDAYGKELLVIKESAAWQHLVVRDGERPLEAKTRWWQFWKW